MDHRDHVELLRGGVTEPGGTWADLGAGTGAFTLALAELLGPGGRIVAVDRDAAALRTNRDVMASRFPAVEFQTVVSDLTGALELPQLDGIVCANSLHFVRPDRQVEVIAGLARHLRPGGTFIVVEYDADRGNPWVPHPFSASRWPALARGAGLDDAREIGRRPSRFLGAIYAAASRRPSAAASRS